MKERGFRGGKFRGLGFEMGREVVVFIDYGRLCGYRVLLLFYSDIGYFFYVVVGKLFLN